MSEQEPKPLRNKLPVLCRVDHYKREVVSTMNGTVRRTYLTEQGRAMLEQARGDLFAPDKPRYALPVEAPDQLAIGDIVVLDEALVTAIVRARFNKNLCVIEDLEKKKKSLYEAVVLARYPSHKSPQPMYKLLLNGWLPEFISHDYMCLSETGITPQFRQVREYRFIGHELDVTFKTLQTGRSPESTLLFLRRLLRIP